MGVSRRHPAFATVTVQGVANTCCKSAVESRRACAGHHRNQWHRKRTRPGTFRCPGLVETWLEGSGRLGLAWRRCAGTLFRTKVRCHAGNACAGGRHVEVHSTSPWRGCGEWGWGSWDWPRVVRGIARSVVRKVIDGLRAVNPRIAHASFKSRMPARRNDFRPASPRSRRWWGDSGLPFDQVHMHV